MRTLLRASFVAALAGWLAIDLYMSCVYVAQGSTPLRLFQWDASNALGDAAYGGGWASAGLGLLLDYAVSLGWAAAAAVALRRSPLARAHPFAFGTLYGAVVMYLMVWAIVPLGRARHGAMTTQSFAIVLLGHVVFFGIPLVLTARRAMENERTLFGNTPAR